MDVAEADGGSAVPLLVVVGAAVVEGEAGAAEEVAASEALAEVLQVAAARVGIGNQTLCPFASYIF